MMAKYRVNLESGPVIVEAESHEQAFAKASAPRSSAAATVDEKGNILDPLAQGLLLGLPDELAGALGSIPASISLGTFPGGIPEAYRGIRDEMRERESQFAERNPVTSAAANIAGALPTAMAAGARLAGAAPSMGRMIGVGAGEGALAGYGGAEGLPGEQAVQAGMGAVMGGAGGTAGGTAGRLYDRLTAGQTIPQKVIQQGLDADLLNPQLMRSRARQMGAEATPVDVGGEGMVAVGQQVAGATPATRSMAERALVSGRRAGQTDRVLDALEEGTGIRPDYGLMADNIEEVAARRSAQAAPLWDQAMSRQIELTPTLEKALNQRVVKQAFRKAQEEASYTGRELPQIYTQNEAGDLVPSGVIPDMQAWSMIKTHLDDVIDGPGYVNEITGRPTKIGRAAMKFRDEVTSELTRQNPAYQAAMNQWAGESQIIKAVADGRKMLSPSTTVGDVRRAAKTMSQSEKEGYLAGAMEAIRERMGGAPEGQMREFSFMESPNFQQKLRAFLPEGARGDAALERITSRLKTERRFKEVGPKVIGGSQTALREQIESALNPTARTGTIAEDIATGGISGAAMNAVKNQVERIVGGVGPDVKERIAELIFAPGGTENLINYMQQSGVDQARIDNLVRYVRQLPGAFGAGMAVTE